MKKIFAILLIISVLAACHSNTPRQEIADCSFSGDTVRVRENSAVSGKIDILQVELQPYCAEFRTTGTVQAMAGRLAEIAAPFDGRVTTSLVRLGQKVSAGASVFELSSADFHEAAKNYFQSVQNRNTAEKNYRRQHDLVANGVGAQQDLEEAEAEYENVRNEHENATANLRIFGVDPGGVTMGQPLRVISPISGEVVRCNLVIGQYLKSDSEPLAVVADLGKVWVVALIKERYIGAIRQNDKVEVYTDAASRRTIWGHIDHIGEMLDEETRSVQILVECDNRDRELKPGMFTAVHFLGPEEPSLLVPASAIFQSEADDFLFIETSNGCYVKRPVACESADNGQCRILGGLEPGERIVAQGGIYLIE